MSHSNLYQVFKTTSKELTEYHNGHGTAPVIWGYLCEKYLKQERHQWVCSADNQPLWDLAYDDNLPKSLELMHRMTFDHALCLPKDLKELSKQIREACEIINCSSEWSNHWWSISNDLADCEIKDKRCLGVALSCTSVSDPWIDWGNNGKDPSVLWDIFTREMIIDEGGAS